MATAACMLPTDEKADSFRLLSLIIDGGTYVLRHKFDQKFPPSDLQNKLSDPQIRGKLTNLRAKKIITKEQWDLLYPSFSQPHSDDFDISMLSCLLRYVCGLDENAQVWKGIPASFDTSVEADITRLRLFRNKVSHMRVLTLTKHVFHQDWNEMEQVILRIGNGIPQLQSYTQKLKTGSLDPSKEKEYQNAIKEWEKMDENIRQEIDEIKGSVGNQGTRIEGLEQKYKQSSEMLDNLGKDMSINTDKLSNIELKQNDLEESAKRNEEEKLTIFSSLDEKDQRMQQLSDQIIHIQAQSRSPDERKYRGIVSRTNDFMNGICSDQVYIMTDAHIMAREKLQQSKCLVISGLPGEGKTTMAANLMCEMTGPACRVKLNSPDELEKTGIMYNHDIVILIDDIFGDGMFKESLLNKWSIVLPQIHGYAEYLIITTRHHILEQAKKKMSMKVLDMFRNENVQVLTSSELTQLEKSNMLKEHLQHAKREFGCGFVEKCIRLYNTSTLMGLPEIVRLFSSNEQLFNTGPSVFVNPFDFLKSCMEDLFRDDDTFLAMILIWSSPKKKLNRIDLEDYSDRIRYAAGQFGFELNITRKSLVLKTLTYHSNGFLTFSSKTGICTFSHNIVSDMVGLVAGQGEHTAAVLEFAGEDFIMQYITTDQAKDDEFHIYIEEYRFRQLSKAVGKYLLAKPYGIERQTQNNYRRIGVKLPKKVKFREIPLLLGEDVVNAAFVKHDCFNNRKYVEQFVKSDIGKHILYHLTVRFRGQFGYYGIDVGKEMRHVYLPIRALLYGNTMLLDVFLKENCNPSISQSKDFLYMGMLVAAHTGMVNVASLLLRHGGKVCEDAIFIAAENSDLRMLSYLLENRRHDYSYDSNIMNKNSPLITVAKRGLISPLRCLIKHGVDVNYRNANKATALEKAVLYEQTRACKVLLENGANVNEKAGKYKRTPLHLAADIGAKGIVELLIQHEASLTIKDYRGHLPIHCAAMQGKADTVDVMLQADKSLRDYRIASYGTKSFIKGMTLMHVAVWKRDMNLLDILLQNNVNPDSRDFYGRTPFYCAVYKGQYEIVRKLLNGSNVQLADKNGYTPLHAAIHRYHTDIAKLIYPFAEINAQDRFGKTALHTACEQLNIEIFWALITLCNADVRILTHQGKSIMNILHDRLLRPLLSNFLTPKRFKLMSADGVRQGKVYLNADETWKAFRNIVANKDPEFAETWIQIFSRSVPRKK